MQHPGHPRPARPFLQQRDLVHLWHIRMSGAAGGVCTDEILGTKRDCLSIRLFRLFESSPTRPKKPKATNFTTARKALMHGRMTPARALFVDLFYDEPLRIQSGFSRNRVIGNGRTSFFQDTRGYVKSRRNSGKPARAGADYCRNFKTSVFSIAQYLYAPIHTVSHSLKTKCRKSGRPQ